MTNTLNILVAAAAITASFGIAQSAQATTIDFEDIVVAPGTQFETADGATTITGGFEVDAGGNHIHFHNQDGFGDNGGVIAGMHAELNIAQVGGGAFDLFSFDFEYFITDLGSITLNAMLSGGGAISQVFTTDGVANTFGGATSYETFTATGFTNIVSAQIISSGVNVSTTNGFFVDNIATVAAVPVPAALPLLASGLFLVGAAGRRRKNRA